MKKSLKPYHDRLKAMFAQHSQPHVESSQPEDEPITEAPEPIAVGPEPTDPPAHDEKALTEEVARQVGWKVGDLVSGRVTNRQMINQRRVWATVSGWSEMVQVSVHDQSEWPAGSTIKCEYVQANSDGHLVFNSKEHGPKWKRRGSR
jgi:hypothetical protein